MLTLHAPPPDPAALAEPYTADAVRVLISALDDPDRAAAVAAAIGLLAISRGLSFPVVTTEVNGVGVQISAGSDNSSDVRSGC
jgi:hypothetical protein